MNVLSRIQQIDNWTQSEKAVINYIQKDPSAILNLSSRKAAEITFTSISCIYRICDKLGFNGFNEFKLALAQDLKDLKVSAIDYNMPFTQSSTDYEIMSAIKELHSISLEETKSLMDLRTIHEVTALLKKAEKITIFSSSIDTYSADEFAYKMLKINKDVDVCSDPHDQEIRSYIAKKGDVFIIVSYSGKNRMFHKVMPKLRQNGCRVILISSLLENRLDAYADYHIYICSKESSVGGDISNFSTYISTSYIYDVLFSIIYRDNFKECEKLTQGMKEWLKTTSQGE